MCRYNLISLAIIYWYKTCNSFPVKKILSFLNFFNFKVDCRNNHCSQWIVDEMLEILSKIIEEPLLEKMRALQAISIELDESTDVSLLHQLDLHIRYEQIWRTLLTV